MKKLITILLFLVAFNGFTQSSFQLLGDGNWYKVASISGVHGYIDYIYWHATGNNPSMTRGEIEFINAMSYTIQHHQTMGYSAWNQPQFAYLNFTDYSELWVKATNGVNPGTFQINKSVNVTIAGNVSDNNLADNGGILVTYNKLEDNTNISVGNTKTYGTSYFGAYPVGAGNANAYALEVGGPAPTNTSGQATIFFHHHSVVAHQLRYNGGNFFLEAAGNGYGTNSTPNFNVGGNVGIGTTSPNSKLVISDGSNNAISINPGIGASGLGFNRNALDGTIFNPSISAWQFSARDGMFTLEGYNGASPNLMSVLKNGNVGVGTFAPDAKLAVKGQVHAQEVKVDLNVPGPDYVFEKDYQLTSLEEIKNYIDQNKHLPEVPSAKEMEKNGVQLGEMNMLLLKKIEELTLYVIEQEKRIKQLENKK